MTSQTETVSKRPVFLVIGLLAAINVALFSMAPLSTPKDEPKVHSLFKPSVTKYRVIQGEKPAPKVVEQQELHAQSAG